MKPLRFIVAGGDRRQFYLCRMLQEQGNLVTSLAVPDIEWNEQSVTDAWRQCDAVILPLPCTRDGQNLFAPAARNPIPLSSLLKAEGRRPLYFAGKVDSSLSRRWKEQGIKVWDYFAREELNVQNAVPTAEGALSIAMNETVCTLWNSKVLVTGYGRIAKALIPRLLALGCKVTVAARSSVDRSYATALGCSAVSFPELPSRMGEFAVLFNTVPALLFTESLLRAMDTQAVFIDLASAPGGVDYSAAQALNRRVIQALSLPGKAAPYTAAAIIRDTIFLMLEEIGLPPSDS